MNKSFWANKKVLITGHTGFKGSWLSLWLQQRGAIVVGYALKSPSSPSLFELANVGEEMVSIEDDVRNPDRLQRVFVEHQPEIVIHLAAQALVRKSYDMPAETIATNTLGTVNLLETVRNSDCVRVIVCVTSDKCYENKGWPWGYREVDALGGHDPYSISKACAELAITAYRTSFFSPDEHSRHGVAVASARAGNVIGGGDWASDRLIPDIMKGLLSGKPIKIRNPSNTRPWQHVLEPLSGYLILAEKLWADGPKFSQAWNFGPKDELAKPVSWIANYLTKQWDGSTHWEQDSAEHPREDIYLKLDCSKTRLYLDWAPRLNLEEALDWVIKWFEAYRDGKDMGAFTKSQINQYEDIGRQHDQCQ